MSKNSTKYHLELAVNLMFIIAIEGCASPGAPILRTNIDDGCGPLIPNCQNVSPFTEATEYGTVSYYSTWSSAWIEGAQVGLQSGLDDYYEPMNFIYTILQQMFGINGENYPYPPFCMKYNARFDEIANAINRILPALENPIISGKEKYGVFGTDFYNREHRSARWRDRYIITVRETTSKQTVVTIFRDLFISRWKEAFVRAESNGHNEAWILMKIATEITK